ncbi:Hypothetical protein LUCI_2912 [Lucifera butyrica]|uniref:3D domain-containing protein n=1 Tax=Lucifera butyrica TaxID=1351585 RepID=A0A498R9L3_9FIRM|nr:3D domain-containing protein [Lucifera butyrica]VBB07647.1 Hypothetical protein LUCI_2912 [Lucifera butyrica]
MLSKKYAIVAFLVFSVVSYRPATAHASFFLFNIIQGIFSGGHQRAAQNQHPATIVYGMRGKDIFTIQQYLIKAKYLAGMPDGKYGYQTLRAVIQFQRDSGLPVNGVIDEKTRTALKNFRGTRPKAVPVVPHNKPTYSRPRNNNENPSYLYTIPVIATAYTANDEGCTGITYSGHRLRRGLVAVDPDVIPLGTRLYVPGYGVAVADDIGGAIQGNRIDLAMDSLKEAFGWGRRQVTVYVLSKA